MPCGVIRSLWVNPMRPSDAVWWHRPGSRLAQEMACCLMAPSHYLNRCWLVIKGVLWHLPECNFKSHITNVSRLHLFLKLLAILPGANELTQGSHINDRQENMSYWHLPPATGVVARLRLPWTGAARRSSSSSTVLRWSTLQCNMTTYDVWQCAEQAGM